MVGLRMELVPVPVPVARRAYLPSGDHLNFYQNNGDGPWMNGRRRGVYAHPSRRGNNPGNIGALDSIVGKMDKEIGTGSRTTG